MKRQEFWSLAILIFILQGCMTAQDYAHTPTSKLCLDYLTLPSMNVNHEARAEALAQRGESCAGYTGAAAARRDADRAFQNSLQMMQQGMQPAVNYQQGTHTYIINGRQTTCTTTGTMTNCF